MITSTQDIERLEREPYARQVPCSTTLALLQRSAALYGPRPALTFLEGGAADAPARSVSYEALLAGVQRAANLFHAMGAGPEDGIAILAPNMPEAHFALWGAEIAGRACPINHQLNVEHIVTLLEAARVRIVVALGADADLDIWRKAEALRDLHGLSVLRIAVHPADVQAGDFQALLAAQEATLSFDPALTGGRIAACYHTGGTTGAPKLAQHTHANQVHTSWFAPMFYGFDQDTVEINGFPLFHVAGAFVYGLSCLAVGAHQILPTLTGMRNAEFVRNYWRFCERFRVTALAGVPTVLAALLNVPVGNADLTSVRLALTGGSPLPNELAAQFEDRTGIPVRNILGMTESAGLLSIGPAAAPRVAGSTGLRLPYTEVRAVRLAGGEPDLAATCAPGETGVIVARGPHVCPGYTDTARNTGVFAADGWLVSGDLGHLDAHGNVFVTGRAKDVIIRGAHNIDPGMVEEAFLCHPAISMCAVVGEPDAYAGELPVAFATLRPGAAVAPSSILDEVAPRIAERPAIPKRLTLLEAMPMTAIGKIYKPALRLRAIEVKLTEMLADIPGCRLRVEAVDRAGLTVARVHVAGTETPARIATTIGTRLAGLALAIETVVATDEAGITNRR